MDTRIVIQSIRIKNFRSIRNATFDVSKMNIFVGLNDVGKSNILKALNLFFNNSTDYDVEFDFDKDFSFLFPKSSHNTKEITVELRIEIPDSYQNSGIYTWKKSWRRGGQFKEFILDSNGKEPSARSRIPYTLHRIKFRYVPAVKSKEFYKYLLSELYLTAAASLNSPLVDSTMEFAGVIQQYTEQIHKEVSDRIGIESRLTIPADMTEMFKTLIFMTNGQNEEKAIPLNMRGDGIQSRHIPIILKYLAEEDQKTRNQGSVKITSIWGYEEPENGIELLKSFEVAESFHEYAQKIQLFITTHSPAFYQQDNHSDVHVFYVRKSDMSETIITESIDSREIGQSMGLMPLVAPYIAEKEKYLAELKRLANDELLMDIPTIFVEGILDKQYLELAIELYSPELKKMLDTNKLRIFTEEDQGGCREMVSKVLAWIYKNNKSKTLAIFDNDSAGIIAHNDLLSRSEFLQSQNNKTILLQPSDEIVAIMKKGIAFPFEMEHLLSISCWKRIVSLGYTCERSISELNNMLGKHANRYKSASQVLEELIDDKDIRETIIILKPDKESKKKILNLVKSESNECKREYMNGFQRQVSYIEKRFVTRHSDDSSTE